MRVGLRVDVDTFRGTQRGVPNLCRLLAGRAIVATFFFSVGPDNMGRHLWRLLRPGFLWKMLRTKATSLYGWDILLRGTLWPGPIIGDRLAGVVRSTAEAGHEVGLHAWDHHAWQARVERMSDEQIRNALKMGMDKLTGILGRAPACSAVAAWKCTDVVLAEKARLPFRYNSDCRGESIFLPVVNGECLSQPQIPVTLPTYDEILGRDGVTDRNFNEHMMSLLRPDRLNVMTIHAESEGGVCLAMFEEFVAQAQSRGVSFVPLGQLLPSAGSIERGKIARKEIPGRSGWLACQAPA